MSGKSQLVIEYQGFAANIARKLIRTMGLPGELEEELVSAGNLGLVEAANRFDEQSNTEFKNFAYLRVRGAIIDSLRKSSALSSSAYNYAKALSALQDVRQSEFGEVPHKRGVNDESRDRLSRVLEYAAKGALAYRLCFEDEQLESEEEPNDPENLVQRKQSALLCRDLVSRLPVKERIIVERYYFKGHSFSEIADTEDGMNKSWVSRLHSRALGRLKEMYTEAEPV